MMKAKTFWSVAQHGRLPLLLAIQGIQKPINRACFLVGAARGGLLSQLGDGPATLEDLEKAFPGVADMEETLERYLEVGVKLGMLTRKPEGYALQGFLARRLALPENDDLLAFLEEALTVYHKLLLEIPSRLKAGGPPFTLADQDGVLISRSSRLIEPFLQAGIDQMVPSTGPLHVLEVGCGSGTYLRYMRARNPELTALGYELQADVAEEARRNLAEWRVGDGIEVQAGDIRDQTPTGTFDLATMHNNIYYFKWKNRIKALTHVRGFLKPGGRFMLSTACQGGSAFVELLSLWGAATDGAGRLPTQDEQLEQLAAAGFVDAEATQMIPGESFYAFVATNP